MEVSVIYLVLLYFHAQFFYDTQLKFGSFEGRIYEYFNIYQSTGNIAWVQRKTVFRCTSPTWITNLTSCGNIHELVDGAGDLGVDYEVMVAQSATRQIKW